MFKNTIAILSLFMLLLLVGCNGKKEKISSENNPALLNGEVRDYADSINVGIVAKDTMKKSIQRATELDLEGTNIRIQYYAPGVRGRQIWGGLIPYDQVWSAGAHSATHVTFSTDVQVNQTKISAGDYAFFTIPGKEEWTLILNKNYQQHLADDYNDSLDLVRIKVKPTILEDTVQRLTYLVKPKGEGTGSINLYWEKLQLSMPFTLIKNTAAKNGMGSTGNNSLKSLVTKFIRDPVCYMPVTAGISDTTLYKNEVVGFCSRECKALFLESPEKYVAQLKK
jgi:YHS domain-containing protein